MKYIRTKDGIYEVHHEDNAWYYTVLDGMKYHFLLVCKEDVIKQANNIEELGDFVLYRTFDNRLVVRDLPLSTSWESLARDTRNGLLKDIKLAIETDEGLIYQAKMKDVLPNGEIDWGLLCTNK